MQEDSTRWHPTGLRIFTNRDPNEITRILGLRPSKVGNARGTDRWTWVWLWQTGVADTRPFSEHAAAFMAELESHVDALRDLSHDSAVELRTGYAAALGQGGITLERDLIAFLATMGARVNLDLYPPGAAHDLNADLGVSAV